MNLTHPSPTLLKLFNQPHLKFVVESMLAGNSPALVWQDDAGETALIWDKSHCLYLGGNLNHPALPATIADALIPQAQNIHLFKISLTEDEQAAYVPQLFHPYRQESYPRSLFKLNHAAVTTIPIHPPTGFQIRLIDRLLLTDTARPGQADLVEEIELCWVSLDQFLAQGFGVCILDDSGAIVCRCTAEYVSGQVCGVGIATQESVMRQGLATVAAQVFAQRAVREGLTVYWDSWTNNVPSVRVAQKVGFEPVIDYTATLVFLRPE